MDLELFCLLFFPHYCKHPFNQFHRDYFEDVVFGERGFRRARGAPRGYAKSTITALIKPIHDVCYGLENFIVIVSNTQDQATQKLRDIRRELLENTRLITTYGRFFSGGKVAETSYVAHSGDHQTMFVAYGAGSEIRGIRFGESRPSKIICDDVEHSEEVFNESIRRKYEDWYKEVISEIGDEKTNIEFVGTVLHRDSLLKGLIQNPAYESRLYKAVESWSSREDLWDKWRQIFTDLDDKDRLAKSDAFYKENENAMLEGTKVLWPERESYLALMKQMVEKGKRSFFKEKQNSPLGSEDKVFDQFRYYRETKEGFEIEGSGVVIPWQELKHNAYGVLDPSTGQVKAKKGKMGDFSCLLTGFGDSKGRLFVHSDWTRRAPPTKYIAEIFEHHLKYDFQKFGVEINLYRNLLIPNIVAERKRIEDQLKTTVKIPFYEIEQVENKEKRIFTLEPKVSHGWILFNRALSQEFMNQLDDFPHADHDDCPDALEMLWNLLHNRYRASGLSMNAMVGR